MSTLLGRLRALHAGGVAIDRRTIEGLCRELDAGPQGSSPVDWDSALVEHGPPMRVVLTSRVKPRPEVRPPPGIPSPPATPGPPEGVPLPFLYRAVLVEGGPAWEWSRLLLDPVTRQAAPGHDWEPLALPAFER